MVEEQEKQAISKKWAANIERSVNIQQTVHRHIPEDNTVHSHCCENLKSNKLYTVSHVYS
jgi:hypothetical protein